MRTAIIYRSNKNLDTLLANLKDKVDFFHVFPAFEDEEVIEATLQEMFNNIPMYYGCRMSDEELIKYARKYFSSMYKRFSDEEILKKERSREFDRILCDITCYSGVRELCHMDNIRVIKQSNYFQIEYMNTVAAEAAVCKVKVFIDRKDIARGLRREDQICPLACKANYGGLRSEEVVLEAWEDVCRKRGVDYKIVDDIYNLSEMRGQIVVSNSYILERHLEIRIPYKKLPDQLIYKELDDILTEFKL